jgi:hypothetical protein
MKSRVKKASVFDINSPEALALFQKAAKKFTKKATRSKAAAMKVLIAEGIYTKAGNLTKRYR